MFKYDILIPRNTSVVFVPYISPRCFQYKQHNMEVTNFVAFVAYDATALSFDLQNISKERKFSQTKAMVMIMKKYGSQLYR